MKISKKILKVLFILLCVFIGINIGIFAGIYSYDYFYVPDSDIISSKGRNQNDIEKKRLQRKANEIYSIKSNKVEHNHLRQLRRISNKLKRKSSGEIESKRAMIQYFIKAARYYRNKDQLRKFKKIKKRGEVYIDNLSETAKKSLTLNPLIENYDLLTQQRNLKTK